MTDSRERVGNYLVGRQFRETLYGCVRYANHITTNAPFVIKEYEIALGTARLFLVYYCPGWCL